MAQSRDGGNPFAGPGELDNPFQVTRGPSLASSVDSSRFWTGQLVFPFLTFVPGKGRHVGVTVTPDQ